MMIRYVRTEDGRIFKLEDYFIVAELNKGFWVPCEEKSERELDLENGVLLSEADLKEFTSIPGEVITGENIAPLYGFGGEVGSLASSLCGCLKSFLISRIEGSSLPRWIDDRTFLECLACSYVLNRYLALETGYESFDSKVGDIFLNHYAYQLLRKRNGDACPEKKDFAKFLLSLVSDYQDALASEDRVEKAYLPIWDPEFKPTMFQRVFFCLVSRGYLRLKGIPEGELSAKEGEEIPDLSRGEAEACFKFACAFLRLADVLVNPFEGEMAPLDQSHQA